MLRRRLPRTVRGRLALTYGVLTILIILGLGSILVWLNRGHYEDRLAAQLQEEARFASVIVASDLGAGLTPELIDAHIKQVGAGIEARLTVIDPNGDVIADSDVEIAAVGNQLQREDTRLAIAAGRAGEDRIEAVTTDGELGVTVPIANAGGFVVRTSLPTTDVDASIRRATRDVVLMAFVASVFALAAAMFVAARITGPLDQLRRHSAMVASGQFEGAVEPDETLELGDLARSFNLMTRRLRDLVTESDRSRARLEAIFSNLSDGVVVVDPNFTVVAINEAAAKLAGVSSVWSIDKPFVVVVRDADLQELVREAFAASSAKTASVNYLHSGRFLDAAVQPFVSGRQHLGVVVLRDVSELRRLESVRREFVANVSHELRTPLASIRALVETLQAGAIDDPDVSAEFLGRTVGEVDRLTTLVDELLDLARLDSGRLALNLQAIAPRELIHAGVDRLRPQVERGKLQLQCDIDLDLPDVLADRARIEQVLLNLVHNAIKFTPPGGTITVDARREGEQVVVAVRDTGSGISDAELPRVFERFYKSDKARRSDGTGLGLAIAKHIVQAHGGTIHVDSAAGAGSEFWFTLPVAGVVI